MPQAKWCNIWHYHFYLIKYSCVVSHKKSKVKPFVVGNNWCQMFVRLIDIEYLDGQIGTIILQNQKEIYSKQTCVLKLSFDFVSVFENLTCHRWIIGSGALPGLMLDLGLLKMIWGGVFY